MEITPTTKGLRSVRTNKLPRATLPRSSSKPDDRPGVLVNLKVGGAPKALRNLRTSQALEVHLALKALMVLRISNSRRARRIPRYIRANGALGLPSLEALRTRMVLRGFKAHNVPLGHLLVSEVRHLPSVLRASRDPKVLDASNSSGSIRAPGPLRSLSTLSQSC